MDNLLAAVEEAGVVGAGGAGFPTHVKLASKVESIIVNGAECEPLLYVDQELCKAYPLELVEALQACMSATGAKKGVFALKEKYQKSRAALERATDGHDQLSVHAMGNYYPAGDEHVLVHDVMGRVVPEGGLPLHVGAVVINVETLYNVYRALQGRPVTDTYVTVCGAVAQPSTLRLPVGTSIEYALEAVGGVTCDDPVVIHGGPVMGSLISMEAPVTKLTKGLVVLPQDHPHVRRRSLAAHVSMERAITACCQCRQCTDMCPRALLGHAIAPHKMMRAFGYALTKDTDAWSAAFLCSDCGVCDTFACEAGLSPRQVFQAVKAELAAAGVKNPHHAAPQPQSELPWRRVPTDRLIWRMGLADYLAEAPLVAEVLEPVLVKVPLKQNVGAAAVPVVEVGVQVSRGQLVAEPPPKALGARHHASIDGTVIALGDEVTISREG